MIIQRFANEHTQLQEDTPLTESIPIFELRGELSFIIEEKSVQISAQTQTDLISIDDIWNMWRALQPICNQLALVTRFPLY